LALYVYLTIITFIFAFGIFWVALDFAQISGRSSFTSLVNDSSDPVATSSQQTESNLNLIWTYWPVALLIILFLMGFVAVQRQDMFGGFGE